MTRTAWAAESWGHVRESGSLPPSGLAVWMASLGAERASRHLVDLLSREERQSAERILSVRERDLALSSRAFLRLLLGRYLGCAPRAICFGTGRWGKPAVTHPATSLHFNVTHSGALVLVAISRERVGVDVERHRPRADIPGIASRFYDEEEARWVCRHEAEERLEAFLRLWCRKEAVVKAFGLALTAHSREAVVLGDTRGVSWLGREAVMERVHWMDLRLGEGYSAAVATMSEPPDPALYRLESDGASWPPVGWT